MRAGVRALGVAESYDDAESTLAGAVVRADRVADGFVLGTCTVGGDDATDAVADMVARLGREDVRYLLLSGVAPAWFNLFDLPALHERTGVPTVSVTYEESRGLESAIREAFDDPATVADRLETYRDQPDRRPVTVDDRRLYVRAVGIDDAAAADAVRAFTPEGGRPEPLRVARLVARAAADVVDRDR